MLYRNKDGLTFEPANDSWNYNHKAITTGVAFGDLDRDGDLDLVTVDANAPAKVIENLAVQQSENGYLQLELTGGKMNSKAIGSKAILYGRWRISNGGIVHIKRLSILGGTVSPFRSRYYHPRLFGGRMVQWHHFRDERATAGMNV